MKLILINGTGEVLKKYLTAKLPNLRFPSLTHILLAEEQIPLICEIQGHGFWSSDEWRWRLKALGSTAIQKSNMDMEVADEDRYLRKSPLQDFGQRFYFNDFAKKKNS